MTPPRLNRALVLETPVQVPDGAGGWRADWQPVGTLWGDVEARSGRELGLAGVSLSRLALRITLRAAPVGSSMRPAPEQRLRDGERMFSITAVRERDADGRYLICDAEEEMAR